MGTTRDGMLYRLLKPHLRRLSFGIVAVVLEGTANLAEPWPLKIVLDNVLKSKVPSGWLNLFVDHLASGNKLTILNFAAASVLLIALVGAACAFAEKSLTATTGEYLMHDLRQMLYAHIQRLSLEFHNKNRTGELIGCLTSDVDAIQSFVVSGLLGFLVNSLTLLGMVVLMLFLNWRFTLVALSVAPMLFTVVFRYTRRIKAASREVRRKEGEMISVIQEALLSSRLVKAFAQEDHESRRLERESLESIEVGVRARALKVRLSPLVDLIVAVGTCLVLWLGGRMVLSGALTTGSLVLFIWYLSKMYKPMRELAKMTDAYSKAAAGYDRIVELLRTEWTVRDLPGARPAPILRGQIEFDGVTFGYDPARPVLRQVSFRVLPGQVAALVGPTGAGKSTLIHMIPRFYDPDRGSVRVDGIDVKMYRQESLRRQISFVLQETLLFRGPVWYNIAYGKLGATRAEVIRAAEIANAHEFIRRMPQGYDTVVGERGVTLSGGQRQQIAIARAIIRDAPILIMDELGTGLDAASEEQVLDGLEFLMKGKTSIVIAHKLATIRSADVIFVLENGEIVERGQHDELLSKRGLYAGLYDLQFQP
jgi:ATP-binding cassette, subfamily B, bacterial